MKREVKFRAWDIKNKRMVSVDELHNLWSQYSDEDEKENPGIKTTPHVTIINQSYRGDDLKLVVGNGCDLMQFTGLLDKHGKEIYEGDIFECVSKGTMMQGETYFEEGCFKMRYGYQKPTKDQRKDYFLSSVIEHSGAEMIEIIGNIYESPNLLT